MNKRKLFKKLLTGSKNIRFSEATACAESFGFRFDRRNSSHHIYVHPKVPELFLCPSKSSRIIKFTKRQGESKTLSGETIVTTYRTI